MANEADIARNLIVLDNYEWLLQIAKDNQVRMIPFKGIALLRGYDSLCVTRQCADIDVLVPSVEECERLVNALMQHRYHLQFPYAMQRPVLIDKGKVALVSCYHLRVDIDIHLNFVTKKFYAATIGTFQQDALSRCHDSLLDSIDHWLILAQHAVFHDFYSPCLSLL